MGLGLQGQVYVTGPFEVGGAAYDILTYAYDAETGDSLGAQIYNGPAVVDFDEARVLAVDADGNVYVGGGSTGMTSMMSHEGSFPDPRRASKT